MTGGKSPGFRGSNWLDRRFGLQSRNTTVSREALAGLTSFLAAAYLVVVIPSLLATGGLDRAAVTTACILLMVIGSLTMGLYSNFPFIVGPGLGGSVMRDAQTDFSISWVLIPAIDREAPVAEANHMVDLVIANREEGVGGIGIDYRETDRPPELFREAFRVAKAAGLRLTAHAGEFGTSWKNVATVLDDLQVDRVDHGYTVIDNPELVKRCVDQGTVFTVVPTNSYYLRTLEPQQWAIDHPIRRMVELGLKIHPNTDDPALHHVSPAGAWELMYSHFGVVARDLRAMMLHGIDGSWVEEDHKRAWRIQWAGEFDALAAESSL
jgi:hypothetical protein